MNQTESRRKPEGSGVGILCDREARCFGSQRRLCLADRPRLKLWAYLTAPDRGGLEAALGRGKRWHGADPDRITPQKSGGEPAIHCRCPVADSRPT